MRRFLLLILLTLTTTGCAMVQRHWTRMTSGDNPYEEPPFYARYLRPDNPVDREVQATLAELRLHPWHAPLHNRLGELLLEMRFSKDAEVEFRRAIASDARFYPAWYNLGLIRDSRGDYPGAVRALKNTLAHKPGHAAAHFQLGLLYERRGHTEAAIAHYAKAFEINKALLDVRINPRILDSELVMQTLLVNYPLEHSRESIRFEPSPVAYPTPATLVPAPEPAPSPQAEPEDIVTPAPPL